MRPLIRLLVAGATLTFTISTATAQPKEAVDLNVAIFAYLPDASAAIERLEEIFEKRNPGIDIDFELWNPYDDALDDDGMEQIDRFDVAEIDVCRIEELVRGHLGGIEKLPVLNRPASRNYVGSAKAVARSAMGDYVVPHWVCGFSLVTRKSNQAASNAKTFDELLKAMNSREGTALHAGMWGKTGLGEYYADAVGDLDGPTAARKHLIALADAQTPMLHEKAKSAVLRLADELESDNRRALDHFYNHAYIHPRRFAQEPESFLLGYSERLYYVERELQLSPGSSVPVLKLDDIEIRQFPFADRSQGTPSWTDGFVIPKGKLTPEKEAAIKQFLSFVISPEAYLAFAEPTPYLAATYLMPAHVGAFDDAEMKKKQPLLEKFRPQLDESFPVYEVKVWKGMRVAGKKLQVLLKPD